ncbi:MAG: nucleoside hydrolase [Thermoguttaceae bacterium]|nr:nucleoside hydrolase [Thermoguttaceae bacterium]
MISTPPHIVFTSATHHNRRDSVPARDRRNSGRGRLHFARLICLFATFFSSSLTANAQIPVRIILDTDIGNDVDDALSLAVIHTLTHHGKFDLLAVTSSNGSPTTVPYIQMLNEFYGYPQIPIGVATQPACHSDGNYMLPVLRQMKHGVNAVDATNASQSANGTDNVNQPDEKTGIDETNGADKTDETAADAVPFQNTPSAVKVLRQTLAREPNQSVVIVMTGFATNLVRLLDSPADEISPLSGSELVQRKVRLLFVIAGAFSEAYQNLRENNLLCDLPAGRRLAAEWPTPILWSGYEIGKQLVLGPEFLEHQLNPQSPVYLSYRAYGYDHLALWDLVPPLELAYPEQIFTQSETGRVTVREDGTSYFIPEEHGRDRILLQQTPEQLTRAMDLLQGFLSEPVILPK